MARPAQRIFDVAEEQWGLITRSQARSDGIAPSSFARLVDDGRLERIAHGVYRVRGAGEADHLALRAAWLQLDPRTPAWLRVSDLRGPVVSHSSAADLYSVGDLRPDVHEFTLHARRQSRRPDVRLHRRIVPADDRTVLLGLPVTRAGRMIADLLADHVDPSAVAEITAQVIERGLEDPATIAEQLAPFAARFSFRRGDGEALLEHLRLLAGHKDRAEAKAT
jgi:predicted transcriptional regulator of viral defense system